MSKKPNIAILGASGAVGKEFIKLIQDRNFPFNEIKLLASEKSAGTKVLVCGKVHTIEEANPESFDNIDIALFAGGSISKKLAPEAVKRGAIVIDNSSAFRMDPNVPLVIPEINSEDIKWHSGIISNPNCSTIIMLVALNPIHCISPIRRIIVSTYQAVSGAGKDALEELIVETKEYFKGEVYAPKILPYASAKKHYPIAFNLIPHIDKFMDNAYTKEEMKMVNETHKILHDKSIAITATTVRVPVFRSHSESIYIETNEPISIEKIREAIEDAPGVELRDDISEMIYPMPIEATNFYDVSIGRIRKDLYNECGLNLWVSGDQLLKGAALNALQIAEYLIENNMIDKKKA